MTSSAVCTGSRRVRTIAEIRMRMRSVRAAIAAANTIGDGR